MVSNGTDNMVMPVAPMYGGYNGCNGNGFGRPQAFAQGLFQLSLLRAVQQSCGYYGAGHAPFKLCRVLSAYVDANYTAFIKDN